MEQTNNLALAIAEMVSESVKEALSSPSFIGKFVTKLEELDVTFGHVAETPKEESKRRFKNFIEKMISLREDEDALVLPENPTFTQAAQFQVAQITRSDYHTHLVKLTTEEDENLDTILSIMCKNHVFKTQLFHQSLITFFDSFESKFAQLNLALEDDLNLKVAKQVAYDLNQCADKVGAMRVSRAAFDVHRKAHEEIFDEVILFKNKLLVEFKAFKKGMINLYKLVKEDTEMLGLY